jgi:hypothetical protein
MKMCIKDENVQENLSAKCKNIQNNFHQKSCSINLKGSQGTYREK